VPRCLGAVPQSPYANATQTPRCTQDLPCIAPTLDLKATSVKSLIRECSLLVILHCLPSSLACRRVPSAVSRRSRKCKNYANLVSLLCLLVVSDHHNHIPEPRLRGYFAGRIAGVFIWSVLMLCSSATPLGLQTQLITCYHKVGMGMCIPERVLGDKGRGRVVAMVRVRLEGWTCPLTAPPTTCLQLSLLHAASHPSTPGS
jgi:hypothetical protein